VNNKVTNIEHVEKFLNDYINQIVLKISAQDALSDLKSIDLENDKKRVYRVSSVHDGVLPTLPCEIKPKVVTRRRPSS